MEVCIKIIPTPGDTPKLYGRHFDFNDQLVSKVFFNSQPHYFYVIALFVYRYIYIFYLFEKFQISRESIDACKEYFRDDLQKPDWQLMVELKKLFQIL